MFPLSCSKTVGFSIKLFLGLTIVICTLTFLTGCAGMLADSMAKSWVTGETYGKMATTLAPPADGNGRLFIYRTNTSTKRSVQFGIGIVKNATLCTVDDTAYEIVWEVFRYFDLPEGQHEVTCGQDILKKQSWSGKRSFQRGANKIQIQVSNAVDTFIKVDSTNEEPFFRLAIVDNEQARKEIFELSYQKKDGHTFHGGKIAEE